MSTSNSDDFTKVLMIEDDEELAEILCEFLYQNSILTENFPEPYSAISHFKFNKNYDLIILDLSLPNLDGLEVCKKIREISSIPIIISSARSEIEDKIDAFELGADDYLPKPYNPRELIARIGSLLRRTSHTSPKEEIDKKESEELFRVDKANYDLFFRDRALDLTRGEFEIFSTLYESKNRAISREEILESCQTLDSLSCHKSIDVIIGRLRAKIESDTKNPKYIKTVRGIGYRFCQ